MGLPKEDDDVRPIAIGEMFRRLTGKCLWGQVKDLCRDSFGSIQVGVGCPQGTEAVVHTMHQYLHRHQNSTGKLVLTIDYHNAFNTVDRDTFLRTCRQFAPTCAPFASWCYNRSSKLFFHSTVIESAAGVQQGDALGPMLFALALQPLLDSVREIPGIDIVVGYLDDVVISGEAAAVESAFRLLRERSARIGLQLNSAKCQLVPTAGPNSSVNLSAFPNSLVRNLEQGFKLLGAPIGNKEFVASFVDQKRVAKAIAMLQEIPGLEDAQIAHKLLMHCMGPSRVMYGMRTSRPDWIEEALGHSDAAVRRTTELSLGIALSDAQWKQCQLALSKGGLGLRSSSRHAPAAYLASRLSTRILCQEIDSHFLWNDPVHDAGLEAARVAFNQCVEETKQLAPDALYPNEAALPQKYLSGLIDDHDAIRLQTASSTIDKARLKAVGAPHAAAWLQAEPSRHLEQRFGHSEFRAATQLWLGAPIASEDDWCPKCNQIFDTRGHHALECMAGGSAVVAHNSLRDFIYVSCIMSGLNAEREQPNLLADDPRRRPGDVFVPLWPGSGPVALDVAVTSPLQASRLEASARTALAAASEYEDHKRNDRETARQCAFHGLTLVPMVVESFGGWCQSAQDALRTLAHAWAAKQGTDVSTATSFIYAGLSSRLWRANARSLLARVGVEEERRLIGPVSRARGRLIANRC